MKPMEHVTIETREDFVAFMQNLLRDLRECPERWENAGLEEYLEAIAAWVQDMDGYFSNRGESVPSHLTWRNLKCVHFDTKNFRKGLATVVTAPFQRAQLQEFLISNGTHTRVEGTRGTVKGSAIFSISYAVAQSGQKKAAAA